jgi:formylglycine-generating enzyme required for sulfatase activity
LAKLCPWAKREWQQRECPPHRVRITKPFYLGVHEVAQAEYERVMGKNPSYFSATGDGKDKMSGMDASRFPVERVSWDLSYRKRKQRGMCTGCRRKRNGSTPAVQERLHHFTLAPN